MSSKTSTRTSSAVTSPSCPRPPSWLFNRGSWCIASRSSRVEDRACGGKSQASVGKLQPVAAEKGSPVKDRRGPREIRAFLLLSVAIAGCGGSSASKPSPTTAEPSAVAPAETSTTPGPETAPATRVSSAERLQVNFKRRIQSNIATSGRPQDPAGRCQARKPGYCGCR